MEVRFTSEQETRLSQIANQSGTDTEQLVRDAALRLLEEDDRFRAGVQKGLDSAARGDFIEEEEMDARIDRILKFAGLHLPPKIWQAFTRELLSERLPHIVAYAHMASRAGPIAFCRSLFALQRICRRALRQAWLINWPIRRRC